MSIFASPRFLRHVMWADAASCAATGALQLVVTQPLADLTGLPALLLTATGLFLLAYASAAAWMARRRPLPRTLIGLVALGNLGWALGCAVLVFGSGLALSAWGLAWVAAQAVVVLVLADLQWAGLRATRHQARQEAQLAL
ncbi:membrane protein [Comamonas testosteroni TK102]|uniref:Membrane protein n=1 Tax=Comamonas testosteroni TK102 TaxID=1392005 RepID=A0A076PWB6_COMTE|nr:MULTISPECIES: hypothetical protein [Comamonas]AIJ48085.1 membrane protein [Comamonas testosteroni TK102]MPS90961.1 hypothetical protein [Comamonas sp.]